MLKHHVRSSITATLAALASVALLCLPAPAFADNIPIVNSMPNTTHYAVADATAGYTNATTTASDITGATITVPKTSKPLVGNTSGGPTGIAQALRICYYAGASKATATTGTITVLVNGTSVAGAARSIGITTGTLSTCYVVARPVATSFVVKLQGVSGDTNTFTVSNAELTTEVLYFN